MESVGVEVRQREASAGQTNECSGRMARPAEEF